MAVPSTSASASAASPPTKASRSQQQHVYSRRSNTLPVLLNSLLFSNRHGTVKSIKSLNVYCLSEIFNYLEYRDLATARLVCTYWNECFQFHLKRRTHFSYGKALNNLPGRKAKAAAAEVTQRRQKVPLQNNIVLNTNLLYACERCIALNGKSAKEEEEETLLLDYHELHERSPSPSACSESSSSSSGGSASESGSNSEEEGTGISSSSNSTSCFSPSSTISMTPADSVISPSPPPPSTLPSSQQSLLVNRNHDSDAANNAFSDFANRCSECQAMLTEFHQQLQQEMATAAEQDGEAAAEEGEDYFAGFIDKINVKVFEGVLALMPRLTALKLAQGYRYGRLRQSALEVAGVSLVERIFAFCPHLIRLDLSNCIGLVEADFSRLVECYGGQLQSLNVSGTRIDEACLRVIVKGADHLRYLNVANNFCDLQGGCFEWISDAIETVVADYNQNVRTLDGLLQGKGREVIELELNVGFCINSAMPYNMIGNNFKHLLSLKLTFKSFGKRKLGSLVGLAALTDLECLYLLEEIDDFDSESSLDDQSVLAIMRSTGQTLRELYLHAASSLFGRGSCLTDAAIVHVDALCPLLEVFSIKRAAITDASLEAIGRLKNAFSVALIDLEGISKGGVQRVMSSFKSIEKQELEEVKRTIGVDLNVNKGEGPKCETMKRHCSLTPEMEGAITGHY
ncbi:Dynein regulatory complex subunit 6 [Tyrophagus putrescentiae]|nr:Dynein regulatory complex subunit 6 [Tyrophagus putrescentiae]